MAKTPTQKKATAKPVEDETTDLGEDDDGVGPKGDPGSDDLSAPVDEALDPEAEKDLRAFYKANPDAMRKWVDTDATAFADFMPAEPEEEVAETDELISEVEEGDDSTEVSEEDEEVTNAMRDDDFSLDPVENVFCPTGAGGGRDPSCSPGGVKASGTNGIKGEPKTAPPPGPSHAPDVMADHNRDGVTDSSRVGVPGHSVPPPPRLGRLPNLTPHERAIEHEFIEAFERDPTHFASKFREIVKAGTKPGEAPAFGTDDAKVLHAAWSHEDPVVRAQNRATLNLALHQTANAVAKRSFLQELDSLKEGDEVMVTVGGCGAGKGYALKNVPEALAVKGRVKAVWDSAGDQNATENPWIQQEAERRGLKVTYVYVHADPRVSWAHPEAGVVKRAADPKDGRMVDATVFADSYELGAKNHAQFASQHMGNPNASFIFLENKIGAKPRLLPGMPSEALAIDRKELTSFAIQAVQEGDAPRHVKRGATLGARIWKGEDK